MAIEPNLILGRDVIGVVKSFNIIGVIFTDNLSWNEHVDYVHKKARRVVGTLSKYRTIFTPSVKITIFSGLVQSYFFYCHLVWGTTTLQDIKKFSLCKK